MSTNIQIVNNIFWVFFLESLFSYYITATEFWHPAICWMTILISLFSVIGVVIMDGSVAIAAIAVYVDIHCYINLPILKKSNIRFFKIIWFFKKYLKFSKKDQKY